MHTVHKQGFALPSILISSVILLLVLVTAVSATVAIRNSLRDQRYTQLADLAGEAGTSFARACMTQSGGAVTWSAAAPLKPNTDCNGVELANLSPYVLEEDGVRTFFVVNPPSSETAIVGQGYIEILRSSTGSVWRSFGSSVATAQSGGTNNPTGTSIEGYWTSPPPGYLLEDGSAVSRTEYAALFAVIGTTFGAGNGSTTFNLPDSRGHVTVNRDTRDTDFDVIGEKRGAKTHTLTIAEMPSHTHTQNAHSHLAWHRNDDYKAGTGDMPGFDAQAMLNPNVYSYSHSTAAATATNQNTGGGGAHNNLQPSIVVTRAIKF